MKQFLADLWSFLTDRRPVRRPAPKPAPDQPEINTLIIGNGDPDDWQTYEARFLCPICLKDEIRVGSGSMSLGGKEIAEEIIEAEHMHHHHGGEPLWEDCHCDRCAPPC